MQGAPSNEPPPFLQRASQHNFPARPQKPEANFRAHHEVDPEDFEAAAEAIGGALDDEEGAEDDESEEEDDDDERDHGLGEESSTETEPEESEEEEPSLQAGLPPHVEALPTNAEGPNTWIREQYKEYCRDLSANHIELDANEQAAVRLMVLLRNKKAPLNAYKALMEWHVREKGDINEHQAINEAPSYINRKAMLRKLGKRYNFLNKYPYQKKVKLPVSGTVIRQTLHYAPAVIQGLLTDPRLRDAEYLFYNDDPLAPPPKKHVTVGDLHTGKAFRDTHKVLITPGKREQLLPIIVYTDGSAVSHFHNMELIQVKVSLGFWSRNTRKKEESWGILGYIEQVHKDGGQGSELWAKANHMEAQDGIDLEDGESQCESLQGVGNEKKQDYHAQLASILEGLKDLIETGFLWDMRYKDVFY